MCCCCRPSSYSGNTRTLTLSDFNILLCMCVCVMVRVNTKAHALTIIFCFFFLIQLTKIQILLPAMFCPTPPSGGGGLQRHAEGVQLFQMRTVLVKCLDRYMHTVHFVPFFSDKYNLFHHDFVTLYKTHAVKSFWRSQNKSSLLGFS